MLFYLPLSWKKYCSAQALLGTLERLDLLLEVLFLGGTTVKQPRRIDCCLPDDLNIPPAFEQQVVTKTEHFILFSSIKSKPA